MHKSKVGTEHRSVSSDSSWLYNVKLLSAFKWNKSDLNILYKRSDIYIIYLYYIDRMQRSNTDSYISLILSKFAFVTFNHAYTAVLGPATVHSVIVV